MTSPHQINIVVRVIIKSSVSGVSHNILWPLVTLYKNDPKELHIVKYMCEKRAHTVERSDTRMGKIMTGRIVIFIDFNFNQFSIVFMLQRKPMVVALLKAWHWFTAMPDS